MNRERARDAQPLLLPARQTAAGTSQAILDLFPKRRLAQAFLDYGIAFSAADLYAIQGQPRSDVSSIDIVGNGVGF